VYSKSKTIINHKNKNTCITKLFLFHFFLTKLDNHRNIIFSFCSRKRIHQQWPLKLQPSPSPFLPSHPLSVAAAISPSYELKVKVHSNILSFFILFMLFLFVCLLSNWFWFRIFHGPVGIYCVFRINAPSSVCLVSVVGVGCCCLVTVLCYPEDVCENACEGVMKFWVLFLNLFGASWVGFWILMLNFMFLKFESFLGFRRILDMEKEMLSAADV
jgi:hypothetical protein